MPPTRALAEALPAAYRWGRPRVGGATSINDREPAVPPLFSLSVGASQARAGRIFGEKCGGPESGQDVICRRSAASPLFLCTNPPLRPTDSRTYSHWAQISFWPQNASQTPSNGPDAAGCARKAFERIGREILPAFSRADAFLRRALVAPLTPGQVDLVGLGIGCFADEDEQRLQDVLNDLGGQAIQSGNATLFKNIIKVIHQQPQPTSRSRGKCPSPPLASFFGAAAHLVAGKK